MKKHAWEAREGSDVCTECGTERRPHPTLKNRHEYRTTPEDNWCPYQSKCIGKHFQVVRIAHGTVLGVVWDRKDTDRRYTISFNRVFRCDEPVNPYDVRWQWLTRPESFKETTVAAIEALVQAYQES